MGSMSYCLFQNTLSELQECADRLDSGATLSDDEHAAFVEMVSLCSDLARNFAHVRKEAA